MLQTNQVLAKTLETVNLTEIDAICTTNDGRFLACPLDAQKLKQQSHLHLLSTEKLSLVNEQSTKLAVADPTQIIGMTALNSEGLLEYRFVFALVLFYESKMDQN